MVPAKTSAPAAVTEDKSVVPSTPFKAPVPPPVAAKDTPIKSDRKLVKLLLHSVFCSYTDICCYFYVGGVVFVCI